MEGIVNIKGTVKNLRAPWAKGCTSPNPTGRPKRPISDSCIAIMDKQIPDEKLKRLKKAGLPLERGMTFGQGLGSRLVMMGLEGDLKALTIVREIVEGKAPQEQERKDVEIHVIYEDPVPARSPAFDSRLLGGQSSDVDPDKNSDIDPDESSE
jgi:hypothetical protein